MKNKTTEYQVQEQRLGRWQNITIVEPTKRRVLAITKAQNKGNDEHAAKYRAVKVTTEIL